MFKNVLKSLVEEKKRQNSEQQNLSNKNQVAQKLCKEKNTGRCSGVGEGKG